MPLEDGRACPGVRLVPRWNRELGPTRALRLRQAFACGCRWRTAGLARASGLSRDEKGIWVRLELFACARHSLADAVGGRPGLPGRPACPETKKGFGSD